MIDLLWFLHTEFWKLLFFICTAAGIALFVHALSEWTDWKKIIHEIKQWIIYVKTIEIPKEKIARKEFYQKYIRR